MITKQALANILKEAGFNEKAINRILNKNISTILSRGKEEKIINILKLLNEFQISKESIENSLLILTRK